MNKLSNAKHNETNRKLMIAQNRNRESEILLGLLSLTFIVFVLIFTTGSFYNSGYAKIQYQISTSSSSSFSLVDLNASNFHYIYYFGYNAYISTPADNSPTTAVFQYYTTTDSLSNLPNLWGSSTNGEVAYDAPNYYLWEISGYNIVNASAEKSTIDNQYQNYTKALYNMNPNGYSIGSYHDSGILFLLSNAPLQTLVNGNTTSLSYNLTQNKLMIFDLANGLMSGIPTSLNCSFISNLTGTFVSSGFGTYTETNYLEFCKIANGYTYSDMSLTLPSNSYAGIVGASLNTASYNFSSSFSYISPIGSTPYCSYSYGYLPNFYFDGSLVNPTPTPTYYTKYYNYLNYYELNISNGNGAFSYYNLNVYPASSSNITFPYASIQMSGNNTYAFRNGLFYTYDFISKPFSIGNPLTSSQITLPNGVQYTEFNPTLSIFGWYPNSTNNANAVYPFLPIAVQNQNKSLNETASMTLTLDIPLNISLPTDVNVSNIQIKQAEFYLESESNSTRVKYVLLNGRSTAGGELIPINFNHILVVSATDKAPAQFLLSTTINLTLEENTTGLTSGYTYARTGLYLPNGVSGLGIPNGESVAINISYNSGFYVYTYKTYSSLPSKANISFVGSNGIILTNSQKSSYSYTTNLSNGYYIPSANLFWTYSTSASYTLEFSTYLNNQLWTSNSKVFYNGINYSIGSNGYINIPDVPANTGITYTTIYHYNTENLLVSGSLTTPSFNPCNPILTYQYTNLASVYVNGSVVGTTKTSNGSITSTGTSQSTLKSSITSTLFTGVSTAFGESFLNVGTFSFVLTSGFLYLVVGLALFGLIEYYFKKKSIYGVIFFAVYVLIGALTQLIPAFLSVIVILTLSVIIALNFKKML